MPSALQFVGGGLLEGVGKGLAEQARETGAAKRERQLKAIEQKNRLERDEKQMEGKAKFERLLADLEHKRTLELEGIKQEGWHGLLDVELATKLTNSLALKAAPGAPTLPSGYRRTEGGLEFTPGGPQDPAQVKALTEAGRDPDGDTTPAQQANNAEIDAARATLDRMGLDKAEILRRIQKATNTGRENPDYDPGLERLVRTATQRKVGKDLKFNLIHRRYLGPPPEFSEPAGPKALPPGVSAEQPDVFDRIGDFFSGGRDTPAPQPGTQQATPARPQALDRFPGRAPSSAPQPQASDGAGNIGAMSLSEIDDLINARGDSLSPAELMAIQARLAALGM